MPVTFEKIKIGSEWSRPELAELWGYKNYYAIARGAVTPRNDNKIILFITCEKQNFQIQYEDKLNGKRLNIQGETSHTADDRIINAEKNGDEIHLFYRERHHMPFIYYGRIRLTNHTVFSREPSRFSFELI